MQAETQPIVFDESVLKALIPCEICRMRFVAGKEPLKYRHSLERMWSRHKDETEETAHIVHDGDCGFEAKRIWYPDVPYTTHRVRKEDL